MSLYPLMIRTLPKAVAAHGMRPAAVTLFNKLGPRFLATSAARKPYHDDDLLNKTYSDAFDESDSLEVGKRREVAAKPAAASSSYPSSLWASHFRDIDNFFSRDPFFRDPLKDPFAAPLFRPRHDPWSSIPMPVLRGFPRIPGQTLLRSSPGYEINETDGCIKISVDIPDGIKASDMKVEVENDGTLLHLSGKLELEKDRTKSLHRFDKQFSIGPHLDVDNMTANFSDGVLVLSAPKVEAAHVEEPPKKTIAISEEPHMLSDDEIVQKNFSSAFDESDWVETGKAA